MHIAICNERLLFRFGLDRALILIGRHLHNAGHRVSVLVNRYDQESVDGWADRVRQIPGPADYLQSNETVADLLAANWDDWYPHDDAPDLVIVGGWPFFSAMDVFRGKGVAVVYLDCGAVPLDGYTGGALVTQQKLRALRREHLPSASHIVSISEFIAQSQSLPDSGGKVPLTVILLGADHMENTVWSGDSERPSRVYLKDRVDQLLAVGSPTVLCLGRWEPHTYKNSEAIFPILDGIACEMGEVRALILADPEQADIPRPYRGRVIPIGFPDDAQLQELMRKVDLGMVHSRWEGFGLPLAEMQWVGCPVLAFADGAHPEVAVDPGILCRTNEEMIQKACQILNGTPEAMVPTQAYDRFRTQFRWDRVLHEWQTLIEEIMLKQQKLHLVMDVTCAAIDPANTGVIRVTRRLARALQSLARVSLVRWDDESQTYVFPHAGEYELLGQFGGPIRSDGAVVSPAGGRIRLDERLHEDPAEQTWLCLTETVRAPVLASAQDFARTHGWRVAAVFYDAIPVLHPEFVKDGSVLDNHASYMRQLSACDVVVPISEFSADCLRSFWQEHGAEQAAIEVNRLAGQLVEPGTADIAGSAREDSKGTLGEQVPASHRAARILCVSTVEPRKNHLRLIDACLALKRRRPDLEFRLDLVGNRYAGADELARKVTQACDAHAEIDWLGIVDDATLIELYRRADFTVYPTLVEGFGVPIVESLAFGKPCLCADTGVMAELAADGGCLTVDVRSTHELSKGLERLLGEPELLKELSHQARSRPVRTWDDYALDFTRLLTRHPPQRSDDAAVGCFPAMAREDAAVEEDEPEFAAGQFDLDRSLYPQCLCDRWQMNHSERMTLQALLAHTRARCVIEVGTYWGGSLSLIAQYAKVVFSIDIEPMPPSVRVFPNVSFITGASDRALPALLDELRRQDLDPELILIDGDHSREGVARDLNIVLKQEIRCPLWIVMHDSMNPGCRAGMLDVDWAANPHVHFVDLDFVPGRLVEHGGGGTGELWGGLGLARLLPQHRRQPLEVQQSAKQMMEALLASQTHPAARTVIGPYKIPTLSRST